MGCTVKSLCVALLFCSYIHSFGMRILHITYTLFASYSEHIHNLCTLNTLLLFMGALCNSQVIVNRYIWWDTTPTFIQELGLGFICKVNMFWLFLTDRFMHLQAEVCSLPVTCEQSYIKWLLSPLKSILGARCMQDVCLVVNPLQQRSWWILQFPFCCFFS